MYIYTMPPNLFFWEVGGEVLNESQPNRICKIYMVPCLSTRACLQRKNCLKK